MTAWRFFVLDGETVVASADVEEIDGRIEVASVVTGAIPAKQVEALVRVEDETSQEDAGVCFAIVPWLFFVGIAVLMKKGERILVIESWDADLGQELYRWDEVRAGLEKVEANRRAAARTRDRAHDTES